MRIKKRYILGAACLGLLSLGIANAPPTLDPELEADLYAVANPSVGSAQASSARPPVQQYISSSIGEAFVSTSSEVWDDASTIARLPNGTRVQLLEIVSFPEIPDFYRCRIRTLAPNRVTGWTMCGDIDER